MPKCNDCDHLIVKTIPEYNSRARDPCLPDIFLLYAPSHRRKQIQRVSEERLNVRQEFLCRAVSVSIK